MHSMIRSGSFYLESVCEQLMSAINQKPRISTNKHESVFVLICVIRGKKITECVSSAAVVAGRFMFAWRGWFMQGTGPT